MTKMHFQAFADSIKFADLPLADKLRMAELIADVAQSFNGRFDRERFFRACGVS